MGCGIARLTCGGGAKIVNESCSERFFSKTEMMKRASAFILGGFGIAGSEVPCF